MLSIGKLGRGQEAYYLSKVAEGAEDYYAGEGEAPGEWAGQAARELGLDGIVEADQLTAMLTGRNPADGSPLLGRQGTPGKGAVPGFDLTFSAPKSASLLWGLGGAEVAAEVKAAHEASVQTALSYMQREACWTRRGAGGAEFVPGNGYLAAAYRHRASRNGDPQLHTHVLVANATRGPDGKWTRLYHPAIYDHATAASYIYEANLRHELTQRLGVRWQATRKGIAEIEGFDDAHLRAFSTRRAEIIEAAGENASAASMQVATLATRKAKEAGLSRGELLERWRARAQEIGLDLEQVLGSGRARQDPAAEGTVFFARVDRALSGGASHFDRRDVVQAVADAMRQGAPAEEVERRADEYLASKSVIRIGEDRVGPRYTTREIWKLEQGALASAEKMKRSKSPPAREIAAAKVLLRRPSLKDGQREMVRRLLVQPGDLAVVIGEAGTGKTYAALAVAEGWAEEGKAVRAVAPTWRAANVMRAEGLEAQSAASLLAELERPRWEGGGNRLAYRSVLLVDEAGMVDSRTLARLIAHAQDAEAKLVLMGDPEQLGEIGAGGLFRAIAERCEPIRLEEVIRHEYAVEREAAKRIREGEGREGLALFEAENRVRVAANAPERREEIVGDWHRAFEAGEDAVMIAKRNADVERLNAIAREVRAGAGALGAEEIEVGGARFAPGDQVITRVNDRPNEVFNRERWRVAEVDPERGSLVLEGIDQDRSVEVGADYLARTNPHSDAPALQHAYAITSYSAQGTTVDRAFVMADPSMDKQELYVATSRSRGETTLYATPEVQAPHEEIAPTREREPIGHLAEAAERDRGQLAAHEIALRSRFARLPTRELRERIGELSGAAGDEAGQTEKRRDLVETIKDQRSDLARSEERRAQAKSLPRRERRAQLAEIERRDASIAESLERFEARLAELPERGDSAWRELRIARAALAEREEQTLAPIRLAPPTYVTNELGDRPRGPADAKRWDQAVSVIEGYRARHGITDPERALGSTAESITQRARQKQAQRKVEAVQKRLGRAVSVERDFGIERTPGL